MSHCLGFDKGTVWRRTLQADIDAASRPEADRKAQEILDSADKALAAAKHEAEALVGDAEKVLADANAGAEKIRKAAQAK